MSSQRTSPTRPTIANVVDLSTVEPEDVSWLWPGRIPLGKLAVLDGDPGLGKSTLVVDLAAHGSAGRPLPGEAAPVRFATLLISGEDGVADTIARRLRAAGAVLDHVRAITGIDTPRGPRLVTIPHDVPFIEQAVAKLAEDRKCPVLVVVDPISAYLGEQVDAHKDSNVRRALLPLQAMAERCNCAVLAIRHLNKGTGSALHRGSGSIAFAGAARIVMLLARDPDDEDARVLGTVKSNLAKFGPSLRFRLVDAGGCARVEWLGSSGLSADDLVEPRDPSERGAGHECKAWLEALLADGPKPAREVYQAASKDGFADRTLERAKRQLNVRATKEKGPKGRWLWSLPGKVANDSPTSIYGDLDDLGDLRGEGRQHRQEVHGSAGGDLGRDPGSDDDDFHFAGLGAVQ